MEKRVLKILHLDKGNSLRSQPSNLKAKPTISLFSSLLTKLLQGKEWGRGGESRKAERKSRRKGHLCRIPGHKRETCYQIDVGVHLYPQIPLLFSYTPLFLCTQIPRVLSLTTVGTWVPLLEDCPSIRAPLCLHAQSHESLDISDS